MVVELQLDLVRENTDDNTIDKIIDEILKIKNVIACTHTDHTNSISTTIRCNKSEADEYLKLIQNIKNIKIVNIRRTFLVNMQENVNVSEKITYEIIKDPINEISRANNQKDYFKAITYSCTIFEYYGKKILLNRLKNKQINISADRIKNLNLEVISILLYSNCLIEEKIYTKINLVKRKRNQFIHYESAIKYSSEEIKELENAIKNAIDCLKYIIEKYQTSTL